MIFTPLYLLLASIFVGSFVFYVYPLRSKHFQNHDSCRHCHFIGLFSSFPVSVLSMEIPSSGPQSLRSELDSFDDKDTASLPTIPGGVTLFTMKTLLEQWSFNSDRTTPVTLADIDDDETTVTEQTPTNQLWNWKPATWFIQKVRWFWLPV